jgi:hypothetical protein
MAPHLAYSGLGGMSPFAQPMGGAGLNMHGVMGGRMTEDQLRDTHEQRLEQLRGLSGIDHSTGRPYQTSDIARRIQSLNVAWPLLTDSDEAGTCGAAIGGTHG